MEKEQALTYNALLDRPYAIRLVRLQGLTSEGLLSLILKDADLSDHPTYSALSYVWGTDRPSYRISVNGQVCYIQHNLWSFFITHHDKLSQAVWLWVDNICINQQSVTEKNRQVPLMGQIYAKARTVIAWLDDPMPPADMQHERNSDASTLLVSTIHSNTWASQVNEVFATRSNAQVMAGALQRLLSHQYWSRLWIVQEVQLARSVDIHWGRHAISGQKLVGFLAFLCQCPELLQGLHCIDLMLVKSNLQILVGYGNEQVDSQDRHVLSVKRADESKVRPSLFALVLGARDLSCSVSHDHVYGLLSLARNGENFLVDYTEPTLRLLLRLIHGEDSMPQQPDVEIVSAALEIDLKDLDIPVISRWQISPSSANPMPSLTTRILTICGFCCGYHECLKVGLRGRRDHIYTICDCYGIIVGWPDIGIYIGLQVVFDERHRQLKMISGLRFAFAIAADRYESASRSSHLHADSLLMLKRGYTSEGFGECLIFLYVPDDDTIQNENSFEDTIYELLLTQGVRYATPVRRVREIITSSRYCREDTQCLEYFRRAGIVYRPSDVAKFVDEWNAGRTNIIGRRGTNQEEMFWVVDRRCIRDGQHLVELLNKPFEGGHFLCIQSG